jgi:hypothetical protein
MEKIFLKETILDNQTGRTYFPGELRIDEDIPASTASRAVGEGKAQAVSGQESAPDGEAGSASPNSPEDPDGDFVA